MAAVTRPKLFIVYELMFRLRKTGCGIAALTIQGHGERKVGREQKRVGVFFLLVFVFLFLCILLFWVFLETIFVSN